MDALEVRIDKAIDKIQRQASVNAPYSARVNAEQEYMLAYQQLVRAGRRPQIRGKYRER